MDNSVSTETLNSLCLGSLAGIILSVESVASPHKSQSTFIPISNSIRQHPFWYEVLHDADVFARQKLPPELWEYHGMPDKKSAVFGLLLGLASLLGLLSTSR